MTEVASATASQMTTAGEQAPIVRPAVGPEAAFKIGRAFEANLFAGDPSPIETLLRDEGLVKSNQELRVIEREEGATLQEFLDSSKKLLQRISAAPSDLAFISNGFRLPAEVLPPESTFEVDLLLALPNPANPNQHIISVGEVKVYPAKGGRTDVGQISSARSQAGLYVQVLKDWLKDIANTENVIVDGSGFLVFSNPKDGSPVLIAGESLSDQEQRARIATEGIRKIAVSPEVKMLLASGSPIDKMAYINEMSEDFTEGCWGHCQMATICFNKALEQDRAVVLGSKTEQQLSSIALSRAVALADGAAKPVDDVERALIQRFSDATFDELEGLSWKW